MDKLSPSCFIPPEKEGALLMYNSTPHPLFQVMFGLPGSGKSTYAKKRAAEGAVIVDADAIVTMIHGGNYRLYKPSWKPLYKAAEEHLVLAALEAGLDVVLDRHCYKRKTRMNWARFIGEKFPKVHREIVRVESPLSLEALAMRRTRRDARSRTEQEWYDVILLMNTLTDFPSDPMVEGYGSLVITPGAQTVDGD